MYQRSLHIRGVSSAIVAIAVLKQTGLATLRFGHPSPGARIQGL